MKFELAHLVGAEVALLTHKGDGTLQGQSGPGIHRLLRLKFNVKISIARKFREFAKNLLCGFFLSRPTRAIFFIFAYLLLKPI